MLATACDTGQRLGAWSAFRAPYAAQSSLGQLNTQHHRPLQRCNVSSASRQLLEFAQGAGGGRSRGLRRVAASDGSIAQCLLASLSHDRLE